MKNFISLYFEIVPGLKIDDIKSEWLKFSKGKELPSKLKSLETIMDRYGCDEVQTNNLVYNAQIYPVGYVL